MTFIYGMNIQTETFMVTFEYCEMYDNKVDDPIQFKGWKVNKVLNHKSYD